VSGKGLPASMLMAVSKALCKSISVRHPESVAETLRDAARDIGRENPEQFFVTLVAGILNARTGELRLANAGHDAPHWLRRGGKVQRIGAAGGGPPLCTVDDFPYEESLHALEPGDVLCMVTDGITEAMNGRGDLYGTARLAALMERLACEPELSPRLAVTAIREEVARFSGGAELADDLTILAVRWDGAGNRQPFNAR
jgi:adenylate cyclase